MKCRLCLLCVFYLGFITLAQAEIFRWLDANGNIQFGDRPPPSSGAKRVEVEVNSYESVSVAPFEAFKSDAAKSRDHKVVMYSTTWCGICKQARRYLSLRKIPFQEYDVENTRKGKQDYAKLKGRGVPILLLGDQRMNGFSEGRFQRLYEAYKK